MQFATRISLKTKRQMQRLSQRDEISLVELLEDALAAYQYRLLIKAGRPKVTGVKGDRSQQFATRVTKEFHTVMHDIASAQGCALVDVLEESLVAYEKLNRLRRRLASGEIPVTTGTLKKQLDDTAALSDEEATNFDLLGWDESDTDGDGYSDTYVDPNGEEE
jgi:predicted HicB family RNase H-like nuclease